MKYIQKKRWPVWGMILLTLLLNVLIISALNKNPHLLWVFIVSIPLFLIATYFAWQTGHLLQQYSPQSLSPAQLSRFEWLSHSAYPTKIASTDLKVQIGNDQCSQPYDTCILIVGSIENAPHDRIFIDTNKEREPKFSGHPVDEELDTYQLTAGGLIWQIGPGYKGCRAENGQFNSKAFKNIARRPAVKMIELKLPSVKNASYPVDSFLGFAERPDHKMDNSLFPGCTFTVFSDPEGMIHFLSDLRELSGGKPIGIRICMGDKKGFNKICYAVQKTQLIPDFMVIEGSFESTGIVHAGQAFHAGMPLYEALWFVSQTLEVYGLKNKIKIIADGKIMSGFDILKALALGADMICTEVPRYRIIKYPGNEEKLSIHLKSQNVQDFHDDLLKDTVQIMKVCGFTSVVDITLSKFFNRLDVMHPENFAGLNCPILYPGSVTRVYNSNLKFHTKGRTKKGLE